MASSRSNLPRLPRRGLLALPLLAALPGCGWRPVYGSIGDKPSPALSEMAAVQVSPQGGRFGQLVQLALQDRFERGGAGHLKRYQLNLGLSLNSDATNILQDSSATRTRMIANANWWLISLEPAGGTLANGSARTVDAYNNFDQQYFASDAENEAVQRRMTDALADQIALQLAGWFSHRAAQASAS